MPNKIRLGFIGANPKSSINSIIILIRSFEKINTNCWR